MSDKDEFKQFFPSENSDDDRLIVEVPSQQQPPFQERIPSAYDPMGEIHVRGRAYRGLAGGRISWWVLISGWIVFGGIFLLVLITAIASQSFGVLIALIFPSIFLLIVLRGTLVKISSSKNRRR